MRVRLMMAVLAGLFSSVTLANSTGPARTQLERFAAGLDSFYAVFEQTVKSQDGRVQDRSHGQVWLKSPDKLRWVYTGDFPELIVADGKDVWIYEESLEQVTVQPQSDQAADSPLMILADVSQLDQQFMVTELGEFDDMWLLELRSLDGESEFERILLGMDADGIRMMAMEDAFGQRTEVRFDEMSRNLETDPMLFVFSAPEGVDVVGVSPRVD